MPRPFLLQPLRNIYEECIYKDLDTWLYSWNLSSQSLLETEALPWEKNTSVAFRQAEEPEKNREMQGMAR